MKTQSAYFLGILATIILGVVGHINLCSACFMSEEINTTVEKSPLVQVNPETLHPFFLTDGSFSVEVNDNFNFNSSEPSFLMPVSESLKNGVIHLKDHFDSHPDKVVQIIGFYDDLETNNSNFPNLGVARANSVKNHLVMLGISSSQIRTESKLMDKLTLEDNVLYGPVAYKILEANPAENKSTPIN